MTALLQRTRSTWHKAPLIAGASLLALLLAACGGGIDVPEATPTSAPLIAPTQPLLSATSVPAPTQEVQAAQEYVIQAGDSLGAIATQFGVTVEALAAANDITNPDLIQPGDTLTIPAP